MAFGLFAVFVIVRFRNIVKDTRDTSFVLWAIVSGISTGTMMFSLAVIGTAFLALVFYYLHAVRFGTRSQFDAMLSLLWRGGEDSPGTLGPLESLLHRYAIRADLAHQRAEEVGGG